MTETEKLIIEKLEALDQKVTKTQLTIENEISRKIDIIGEGHDFLKQRKNSIVYMIHYSR